LFDRKTTHGQKPLFNNLAHGAQIARGGRDEDLGMFGFGITPSLWLAHLKSSKANNVSLTELVTDPTQQRSDPASKSLAAKAK
jgi:hypothetical protein